MKLSRRMKSDHWSAFGHYQGRYKNFVIKIVEGGDGWSRKLDHYWISFQSKKHKKGHNSLWDGNKFYTIEDAKEFAIKWVDDFIKEQR